MKEYIAIQSSGKCLYIQCIWLTNVCQPFSVQLFFYLYAGQFYVFIQTLTAIILDNGQLAQIFRDQVHEHAVSY